MLLWAIATWMFQVRAGDEKEFQIENGCISQVAVGYQG